MAQSTILGGKTYMQITEKIGNLEELDSDGEE